MADRGPTGETFNAAFVSVTVCAPGTGNCHTVDRVMIDTGSVGLRLMASALDNAAALPPVVNAANAPVGACGQFVSGFTWGSLRRADLRLGGSLAASVPIQVISDSSAPYATIPSGCRNIGFNQGTPTALGANGILGVSMFSHDCSTRCVSSIAQRIYFACAHRLGGRNVYPTDARGNFSTLYKGPTYTCTFIDSGSNGNFFDDPDFTVGNINRLTTRSAAFHAAGPFGQSQTFDWGLPFFFGRRAFLALEGAQTPDGTGPYWAC